VAARQEYHYHPVKVMRTKLTTPLWIALWSACAAQAQNSDLGLLGGISGPRGQITEAAGTSVTSGSVTPSFQINYAGQVLQRAVDLYIEVPLVVAVRASGTVVSGPGGTAVAGSAGPDLFFTPGVRLKFSPESRVSFYAAAGFGIASFSATSTIVAPALVATDSRQNSPAFGFGGGVDIRLTRLLSLRGDIRDFVTQRGLGEVTGRNHGLFQLGIAFHF
jgi:opacity protein-like surface antigen